VLLDRHGVVLGAARGPGSSHENLGFDGAVGAVAIAARSAALEAGIDPHHRPMAPLGVYCLAGVDLPIDHRRIARAVRRGGMTVEDIVVNDTFAILRAGTERGWGVAVACGAGMNCIGIAPDGRTARFPALGALSGDWGGGYWLGLSALTSGVRAGDGRGPKTMLAAMVPVTFGMRSPREVMEAIHTGRMAQDRLVDLAPVVFAAAADGDEVARALLDRQADEVVAMVAAAIRRLRIARLDVDVILGGGIFRSGDERMLAQIVEGVAEVAPEAGVAVLDALPVLGAALLGMDRSFGSTAAGLAARRRARESLVPTPTEEGPWPASYSTA
jgi:N-acetylglucosamine kinase-like BadF-type ATPase